MTKNSLRKKYLQLREQLPQKSQKELAQTFYKTEAFQKALGSAQNILIFVPIPNKNELDTSFFIQHLREQNKTILFPQTLWDTHQLQAVRYKEANLKYGKFDVPYMENAVLFEGKIDLVLTPLLIHDQHNYRLGYGGGFYDRFFASLAYSPIKIGVSFFEPIEQIPELEPTDIPLDDVLTPSRIL